MTTPTPQSPADPTPDLSGVEVLHLSRLWPSHGAGTRERAGTTDAAAAANVPAWREADLAAVLRHQLDAPLAEPDLQKAPLPPGVHTFADLFTHPTPSPLLLRRVRDWAKSGMIQRGGDDEFPLPREVAGVLYFACIAAELARLGVRTTALGPEAVTKGCRWALGRPWLDPRVAPLFDEALTSAGS